MRFVKKKQKTVKVIKQVKTNPRRGLLNYMKTEPGHVTSGGKRT
jgi:hypothetical protein